MFVEFKLYQTLSTLRMAIQWFPLCAKNPSSSVNGFFGAVVEKMGVQAISLTLLRAIVIT